MLKYRGLRAKVNWNSKIRRKQSEGQLNFKKKESFWRLKNKEANSYGKTKLIGNCQWMPETQSITQIWKQRGLKVYLKQSLTAF